MNPQLRKLFFLKRIYYAQTPLQIVIVFSVPLFIFSPVLAADDAPGAIRILCAAIVPLVLYALVRTSIRTRYVTRRTLENNYIEPGNSVDIDKVLERSALATQHPTSVMSVIHMLRKNAAWKMFDLIFDFRVRGRSADYLSKHALYTVFDGQLVRQLPHMVFDSKTARGSQFRHLYAGAQRISLEGGFDKYFDVYTPQTYAIDSLSFVTPEIMEKLIAARNYDIEIIGDRLLCYGPLLEPQDLDKLQATGQELVVAFNDNIDSYKDDRLSGEARNTQVTPFARTLVTSMFRPIVAMLALIGIDVGFWYAAFKLDGGDPEMAVYFGLMVVLTVIGIGGVIYRVRKNRRALRAAKRLTDKDKADPSV